MDQMNGGKKRVFLADDHAVVREGLAALVEKTGQFEVVGQCGDGLTAVDEAVAAAPDVVVLDVAMPGLNGIDVCRELGRKLPAAAVLILSMHNGEEFVIRALENGAKGYLLKESAGEELADALRTVAAGQRYLGPGISGAVLTRLHKGSVDLYELLTTRERQVLQLIAEGNTNKKVAEVLSLAVKTVDTHRMRLMRKLRIHDQTSLVKFAVARGIVRTN